MSITVTGLRTHLLDALTTLPHSHELGLSVLISEPKRTASIFPHTPVPPKCYQQEILVVLSSDLPPPQDQTGNIQNSKAEPVPVIAESSSSNDIPQDIDHDHKRKSEKRRRVLVTAISAYLYTFPSISRTESNSILYISKIDSSGYTSTPLPLTRALIVSFLNYFIHTLPNIRIQLFARAQKQYLFANSAKNPKKKVLSGSGLCKWWKGVYEETLTLYMKPKSDGNSDSSSEDLQGKNAKREDLRLNYLIPGYEELEALNMLGKGKILPNSTSWKYKPPFETPIFAPAPSSATSDGGNKNEAGSSLPPTLATLIPSLPDDPKTRFLEELVTDHLQQNTNSSLTKRSQSSNAALNGKGNVEESTGESSKNAISKKSKKERELEEEMKGRKASHIALSKVDQKEFWVRIGFRQECGQDVTGFFTLEKSLVEPKENEKEQAAYDVSTTNIDPISQPAKQISVSPLDLESKIGPSLPASALTPTDGETEIPIVSTPTSVSTKISPLNTKTSTVAKTSHPHKQAYLRPEILSRILTALTNLDFADLPLAVEGTEIWLKQAESIVVGEIGEDGWKECVGIVSAKEGLSMNAAVDMGVRKEREDDQKEVVTTLMPRKKKPKVN
ncbi:uncharacterized protein I303_102989 [Kwoniella dejecticola CBS 10117]|uniref:histone acetyltransferase n=1 Tax=Kwoniella dejecticola CBS 10117 TaxID=1296121 RepID=A0A1A6AAA1_9TREE|nr:uncharacterized protein I303_03009 [Kwoniella dejecticola CBS 10117]OBR86987.1 hypothetical protein I303_03009 [Kwoniella dejecticola CBS 10117]